MVRFGSVDFNFKQKEGDEVVEEFSFKTEINVDKEGFFTTTIPKDAVEFLKERQIRVDRNRSGNEGYYYASDLKELRKLIGKDFNDAISSELIEEKLVIIYGIKTSIAHSKNEAREIVPNATKFWTGVADSNEWYNGTSFRYDSNSSPIKAEVWFRLRNKKTYKMRSGKTFSKYESARKIAESSNNLTMIFLNDILCGAGGLGNESEKKEIDYSDDVALIFINVFKGFAKIIEQLNKLVSPDVIKQISESNIKFLEE